MIPGKPEAKSNSGSGQGEMQARVSLLVQQRMILGYYKARGRGKGGDGSFGNIEMEQCFSRLTAKWKSEQGINT